MDYRRPSFGTLRDVGAQILLAVLYDSGPLRGDTEAARWYRRAAEQGEPFAQSNLFKMYEEGIGVERDYVAAYMWLEIYAPSVEAPLLREYLDRDRTSLEERMTRDQITEAKRLAREWKPKPER